MALREGGPTATNGRRPRSGRDSDRADPVIRSRSGDPAAGEITSLTWCAPEAERMLCWPTGGGWMDRRSIPVRCHVAVANIGPQLVTKTSPLLATVHRCSYTRFSTLLCLLLPQTQPHTHSIGCASRTGPEVSETFIFLGQGMSETFFSRTGNIIPPHRIVCRTH
jgi:hypothetical protein